MSFKRFAVVAVVLFVLGVGASACKKAPKEVEMPPRRPAPPLPTTQTFTSTDHGFYLELPADWEKKENEGGAVVIVTIPPSTPDDVFQESFSVSVDDRSKPKTVDAYLKKAMAAAKKEKAEFKEGAAEAATVGETEGKVWTYEYKDGENAVKVVQWVVLKDNTVYTLQGMALVDTFDATKTKFDEIVASFKFGAPPEEATMTAPEETTGETTEGAGTGGT
jgi:hypothetical protein